MKIDKIKKAPKIKFNLEWFSYGEPHVKNNIKPLYYLYSTYNSHKADKLAVFIIDETIILSKGGKKFTTSKSLIKEF